MVSQADYQNLRKFSEAFKKNPTIHVVLLLRTVFPDRPYIHFVILQALSKEVNAILFSEWAAQHSETEIQTVIKRALSSIKKSAYTERAVTTSRERNQPH